MTMWQMNFIDKITCLKCDEQVRNSKLMRVKFSGYMY